jgi:hypothetical protein
LKTQPKELLGSLLLVIVLSAKYHGTDTINRLESLPIEQNAVKNVSSCMKRNIYSYLETSGGQKSNPYLNVAQFLNTRAD